MKYIGAVLGSKTLTIYYKLSTPLQQALAYIRLLGTKNKIDLELTLFVTITYTIRRLSAIILL